MPVSPVDATLAIRAAANVNRQALISVCEEAADQLLLVDQWPNTPAKGRMRDVLQRLKQGYSDLAVRAGEVSRLCNVVLDMFSAGGSPDPDVEPVTWSTGAW